MTLDVAQDGLARKEKEKVGRESFDYRRNHEEYTR